jgi:cephalosporin hydroxylase
MHRMNIPGDQYTIINKFSTQDEALMEAAKKQYNLLIIDGDHSYSGVKYDFFNYRGMVKRGGYIIFDDYNTSDWPEIKVFVDQEVIDLPELQFIGADWRTAVFRVITPFGSV